MNNGKVRIYELSKELNLDNRDLLAVCDKLNISVKSHSSTITEEEAARIRVAAEKYVHSHTSGKSTPSPNSATKKSTIQPPVKKQQILEIRRHRPPIEPKRPEVEPKPQPPAEPVSNRERPQSPQSLTKPTAPSRPAERDTEPEVLESEVAIVAEEQPETVEAPVAMAPAASAATPPTPPAAVKMDGASPPVEAPVEAIPPAPRPIKPEVNRPVLKRRGEAAAASADSTTAEPSATTTSTTAKVGGQRSERPTSPTKSSDLVLKPKPIELRRKPTRPEAASAEGETAEALTTEGAPVGPPIGLSGEDLGLRRPTPPRPPKRTKGWEEEEEEEQETAKAASKSPVKGKRRAQPLIDEDEELDLDDLDESLDEEDNESESAAAQVNLSLARPPKPRNRPGQPAVAKPAATVAPKARSRSGDRSFRRDRRQEEVRQRPEVVTLTGGISVHDLADLLVGPETELIKILFLKGIAANINQILDIPTATMVAEELGVLVEAGEAEAEAKKVTEMLDVEDLDNLQRRPPVVTIMGHVDHGKTTLLDSIRKTKVAQGEAGGITQHIGAYHVDIEQNGQQQQIVFLDTPGHEAFTAMRARGARVTDIAILVVAADDGVRPQTIEAISHAKAAEVPIVVAINKIDKEEAQPDRVKQELTEFGLVAEEWGGDTIMVPVSAIKGENLDTLLEMILLVAEVEDLYANPDRPAKGTVIEANLDKSRGPVATLLVQNGTLRVGDILVAGSAFGKVRAMIDDRGKRVDVATPSFAVQLLGLNDVPAAGDEFEVYRDEKEARATAQNRIDQQRQSRLQQAMASRRVSLNSLSAQAQEGELKELNLILKADVQGSVEAILGALQQLPQREVQVRILLAAPGEITETDVDLAAASAAVIVGFNTTLASGARQAADQAGVDVREYNIIYKLLEDIQGAMEGLLEPEMVEEPLGQAEVRAVFPVGRGAVAGCYILSGKVVRNSRVRVRRSSEVVYEGNLDSLKRMKEDTREVNAGYECGIGIGSFKDWGLGDIIESFRLVSKRRTLST